MPFPNEHAARQKSPGGFERFRRKHPDGFPEGVDVVYGITSAGKAEVQTVRFDAAKWPPDKASTWLKDHDFKTGIEEATEKRLKRKLDFQGLPVSIEYDAGDKRPYKGGEKTMALPYGYIRGTEGEDGEHVDVYVGPDVTAKNAYVVHQHVPPAGGPDAGAWEYDEDKVMLGFDNDRAAKQGYLSHFPDDRYCGGVSSVPMTHLREMTSWKRAKITKVNEPKRLVTGIVLEPGVVDGQGDEISAEEIEAAAHRFLAGLNKTTGMGLMHQERTPGVQLVESWLAREDGTMNGQPVRAGSWLITAKVEDAALWKRVMLPEDNPEKLRGFSVGGVARASWVV